MYRVAFTLFLSVILAGQVKGFKECKWEHNTRTVASAEKIVLEPNFARRTKEYCENDTSIDSTWIKCGNSEHEDTYMKIECLCGKGNVGECQNFNCSKVCPKEKVCMNGGTLLIDECKDQIIKCNCPDGFSGDLCENVLEQRKCHKDKSVSTTKSQELKECGQGRSNESKCFVQNEAKHRFICDEAATDVKSVKTLDELPLCSNFEDDPSKADPDGWSTWSECDNLDTNQTCLCRSQPCNTQIHQTCNGVKIQVTNCTVHGQWSSWSEWSGCSITCGRSGNQTRSRRCNNPAPNYGGYTCQGSDFDYKKCRGLRRCPVVFNRHSWSDWQTMEELNSTHEKQSKSRFMCKAGIDREKMATACYVKSRVRYCETNTTKCVKADIQTLKGKYFPVDWMVGKYCAVQRKFKGRCPKLYKLGAAFDYSPLNSKQCFCVGLCEPQNLYIKRINRSNG